MSLSPDVCIAADLVVGNLNEDGYLTATDEELADALLQERVPERAAPIPFERGMKGRPTWEAYQPDAGMDIAAADAAGSSADGEADARAAALKTVLEAREIVNHLDPVGVGARDLRECLLIQIAAQRREAEMTLQRAQGQRASRIAILANGLAGEHAESIHRETGRVADVLRHGAVFGAPVPHAESSNGVQGKVSPNGVGHSNGHAGNGAARNGRPHDVFEISAHIVANHLALLQKKDMRELTRNCGAGVEEVQAAVELIRTLDPRPGQRYNQSETRLIEPDVAFVKRDGEYVVLVNEEDMPTLRLSHAYRKMLREKATEKDVREYVKERYKSAIQLLRNIEQRKNTIVRTCEVIVRRQQEFLERGEQGLRPMMIKEVAEEIGVHPSTVSRAVANKYVHTSQGVYELRYFFTEGVNGPEGADLPLVLLKRKVKKLIEDEDPRKPLTDDQLAAELQRQGIRVTRRTVAKYREDMQIPSTHQRRVR
jgi:RNA polymerase sigma-54 factor